MLRIVSPPASLAIAFLTVACTGAQTDNPADLAIRGVTVLSPIDGSALPGQTVVIEGGRIVDVVGADAPGPEAAIVADADGLYLMPGLWDFHTHLGMADPHATALMVTQGVIGARDLGAVPADIEAVRARIATGGTLGPRVVRVGPTLNGAPNGPHHRVISTPEEARTAVAELAAMGVDLLKTHNATERAPYFALLEAAQEAGLDVVGHVPTTVSPIEACEAGQASVEHIATIFEGVYVTAFASELEAFQGMAEWLENEAPALVECYAREGTVFVPTLRAYDYRAHRAAYYDDPPEGWEYLSAEGRARFREENVPGAADRLGPIIRLRESLVEVGQTFARMLYEAGASVGAGTDFAGPGLVPGFSIHREIELLHAAGIPAHAAIWASARGPGQNAGGEPFTGHIEPGAPADLVLLGANPFDDVRALSSIEGVVLRGRLYDRADLDAILVDLASR